MTENRRVLIIDDNPSIHDDFRKVLEPQDPTNPSLYAKEAAIFGDTASSMEGSGFELEFALQGEEGLEMVAEAFRSSQPYALAFVDIRMPPGMDGVETIERIWAVDSRIQFVICSAYSDYAARDILNRVGVSDRLLLLRKPCDSAEILMIATALCKKWNLSHPLHA